MGLHLVSAQARCSRAHVGRLMHSMWSRPTSFSSKHSTLVTRSRMRPKATASPHWPASAAAHQARASCSREMGQQRQRPRVEVAGWPSLARQYLQRSHHLWLAPARHDHWQQWRKAGPTPVRTRLPPRSARPAWALRRSPQLAPCVAPPSRDRAMIAFATHAQPAEQNAVMPRQDRLEGKAEGHTLGREQRRTGGSKRQRQLRRQSPWGSRCITEH